ncbi:MAG: F-box protein [Candidatus Endonucleobacter bathymodioli]|uniref:F-box protein n=1 Tax=Candidatus Endonucleibacter bathymodioli TaxID=539814 RepID=A0AA90SZ35_9GAMM|nr:F-box protein [Candidatus Endonucleobacter bathymodioli]
MIKVKLFFLTLVMLLSDISIASVDSLNSEAQGGSELDAQEQQVLFSELPDVIIRNIFSRLSMQDVYNFSRTCHTLKNFVADNAFIARNFFSKLSSWQQDKIKRNAAAISEKQLTAWVNQFTDKEQIADDLINLKNSGCSYFPHVLWHTISLLMVNCSKFRLCHKAYLPQDSCDFRFSADSRHAVCLRNREIVILSQDNNGEWIKKSTTNYKSDIKNISFHNDSSHVQIIDDNKNHTIWGLDTNGEWCNKFTCIHETSHRTCCISDNYLHMVTIDTNCHGKRVSIWSLEPNGQLTGETIIGESTEIFNKPIIYFSPDNANIISTLYNGISSVWGLGIDGKWVEKAILSNNEKVYYVKMSADGSHILIGNDMSLDVLSMNDSGAWIQKTHIPVIRHMEPKGVRSKAGSRICSKYMRKSKISVIIRMVPKAISADGTHVVIHDTSSGQIQIWCLISAGKWIVTAFIEGYVTKAIFSADGRHLALGCNNGCIMVWGLTKDKEMDRKSQNLSLQRQHQDHLL